MVVDLGLIVGWAEEAQGAVKPLAVVGHLDELEGGSPKPSQAGPGMAVDELAIGLLYFLPASAAPRFSPAVAKADAPTTAEMTRLVLLRRTSG